MASRFASNLLVGLYATFLLVACFAFHPAALGWLALAIGCATLITVLVAFAFRGRGRAQRMVDVVAAVIGAWTIVAARAFDGSTLKWLSFAGAAALLALATAGLAAHELVSERTLVTVTELPRNGRSQASLRDQRQLAAR